MIKLYCQKSLIIGDNFVDIKYEKVTNKVIKKNLFYCDTIVDTKIP